MRTGTRRYRSGIVIFTVVALLVLSIPLVAAPLRDWYPTPSLYKQVFSQAKGNPINQQTLPYNLRMPVVFNDYFTGQGKRTVNIPFFATPSNGDYMDDAQWTQAAIFWFGTNQQGPLSINYVDVRVAYTNYGIHFRMTPVDYYLWYKDNPSASEDLTQWDSIAIYLDTNFNQSQQPDPNDYYFLTSGNIWINPNNPNAYRRDARGTNAAWNLSWTGSWLDHYGGVWSSDPGWNSNSGSLDYGADASIAVPWGTLGLTGPPGSNTRWGLAVAMYDRDDSGAGGVLPAQNWPENANVNSPRTWGVLHFGNFTYTPPSGTVQGTTTIRASSPLDNTVEDAWIGGGGSCSGGHEGGTETNHGDDTSLFVASQVLSADFPCFSRSYLRFNLGALPQGKKILSATLTLRHWSNALPSQAQPSWVHLFMIRDPWTEMGVHWNNAPMAQENISAVWINPRGEVFNAIGDPYQWDATYAVMDAYKQGNSLNLAIYSSDTEMHSSKYLGSSESYDIYAVNRPTLEVKWGNP